MSTESFVSRHVGPNSDQVEKMLSTMGFASIDALIDKTVPSNIRLKKDLNLPEGLSEFQYLDHIRGIAGRNKVYRSFIGTGYNPTVVPPVILRNVLENPGWYTAYTPYQAEIAQGRLEALLNFQTMCSDLTGMEISNASLLDEGTAAAEAMIMFQHEMSRAKTQAGANKFFVDQQVFPQTLDILFTRALPLGVEIIVGDWASAKLDESYFGACVQYPDAKGNVHDYKAFADSVHAVEASLLVVADIMSLALLTPPASWGADAVVGNTQRFGVPMGFGGPHAAFFSTHEKFKRSLPGRIIGVSQDRLGKSGYRMALQTREQHIRRDKATSNICTAQALLAVMASMYAVYHGPRGIRRTAMKIHNQTIALAKGLESAAVKLLGQRYFDTLCLSGVHADEIKMKSEAAGMNFGYHPEGHVTISLNEKTTDQDVADILALFGVVGETHTSHEENSAVLGGQLRKVDYLSHPVFNTYHSETSMMRYIKKLENRDLSLTHAMIPLGSCTMKLNAASELMPITWPEFSDIHPFAPANQREGYTEMILQLEKDLCEITGFAGMSLQPNSGAQGEYAGLLVIMAYHQSRNEGHRNICLIPSSAPGTNPASAVMAGMKVVVTKCDERGNVDVADLREKAEQYRDNLAAFMITYPSTHGVFEGAIVEINEIIHANGGQVYMDGANMNAQVGLTNPGNIGADVCHLNLHKTFAIPHGGGGPGMGPIGVAKHLVPFLPGNPVVKSGGSQAIRAVSAAPWGSALILLISYGYIKMLGKHGLRKSTEMAIFNANYLKARLSKYYDVLYTGENGTVAHEMILDCRSFKKDGGIEVADLAKRLIDYGFHAPTVSFPVAGTLMIEPTESEDKAELDRFCEAMIQIRAEVESVINGQADATDNVLINAPHTVDEVSASLWTHPYTREQAAYPLPYLREAKFWSAVSRVDNAYGDRNLVCSCPPLSNYVEEIA